MKKAGKIFRWMLHSIIIQVLLLSYLNFIYLPAGSHVTLSVFEEFDLGSGREFKVPDSAMDIRISFDGAYAAYTMEDSLVILETLKGRRVKTLKCGKGEPTCFGWLPDRNMVIYSRRPNDEKQGRLEIATYDVESDFERVFPSIGDIPAESRVSDIQLSTLTNMVYVKVNTGQSEATVFKYNIMDKLTTVMKTGADTVIKGMVYHDRLVFQDRRFQLYIKDQNGEYALPFQAKMLLLGVDLEDVIYAGELGADGKVSAIYYGKPEALKKHEGEKRILEKAVVPENIILHPRGGFFVLDTQRDVLCSPDGLKEMVLGGEFLELHDGFVVTRSQNRVKITPIRRHDG